MAEHNGIGAILGGGVDIPLTKRFSWRLIEADYLYSRHNFANIAGSQFPDLRRPTLNSTRLRTGVVINWGGAPAVTPTAACSVQPTEVMVGEPITATVVPGNFNPKHTLTYSWSGNGGQVTGKDRQRVPQRKPRLRTHGLRGGLHDLDATRTQAVRSGLAAGGVVSLKR